jgi:hypothetical protein
MDAYQARLARHLNDLVGALLWLGACLLTFGSCVAAALIALG